MPAVKFEDLLGSGAHFGHVTRKWNPNFNPFILSEKNGVHIIDLECTIKSIDEASSFVKKIVALVMGTLFFFLFFRFSKHISIFYRLHKIKFLI